MASSAHAWTVPVRFLGVLALLGLAYWIVVRSCGYDHGAVLTYGLYVLGAVWLPGLVVLRWIERRPVSLLESLALGLPIGFSAEILTFFAASALHGRAALPYMPVLWLVLLGVEGWQCRRGQVAYWAAGDVSAPVWTALSALLVAVVATIACQFYVGSPLSGPVLATATHHDWAYLLSRAAEIKQHWPLGDPSLAGAPLTYHYFLLVHVAAASLVSGVSLELVAFRLFVLPLAVALLAQGFVLGRSASRSSLGGLLAVCLVLAAGEVSFVASTDHSTFGNLFVRWLFISPTFFFGMIFSGALIWWVHRAVAQPWASRWLWPCLAALAAVATGAKGTVVPPLLVALAAWAAAEGIRSRRFPWRGLATGSALAVGFACVYFSTLSAWGTGSAQLSAFASMGVAEFWTAHQPHWVNVLEAHGMSGRLSSLLASAACGACVFAGFCGVRLAGLWGILRWRTMPHASLALWLGFVAGAALLFGQSLWMDSWSQLYLYLPIQLPLGVLAAAALVKLGIAFWERAKQADAGAGVHARRLLLLCVLAAGIAAAATGALAWWSAAVLVAAVALVLGPGKSTRAPGGWRAFFGFSRQALPFAALLVVFAIQVNHWRLRSMQGLEMWRLQSRRPTPPEWTLLREGMEWIRLNTPGDAVILANAFTDRNVGAASLACIDDTTVDKYYYYSAFSRRRFWVEGPAYMADQAEVHRRLHEASQIFYGGVAPRLMAVSDGQKPSYLLVDRSVRDSAEPNLPASALVYRNARISVFLLRPAGQFAAGGASPY